jgi:hypothetical protein
MPLPIPGPGRPPGSRNKRSLAVEEKLAELGCDPISATALLAMDETVALELRIKLYCELAGYVAPKLKAIEHGGNLVAPPFVIFGVEPDATSADWERRNNPDAKDKLQ